MQHSHHKRSGFTLLEMLLVVFLIGIVGSSMLLVVDNNSDQIRYDETLVRHQAIRNAITGTPWLNTNGQPVRNGFIHDMGRAPNSLDELIQQTGDPVSAIEIDVSGTPNSGSSIYHGWNGPYLTNLNNNLKDSWGREFVYAYDETVKRMDLQSFGKDRAAGFDSESPDALYEADYPNAANMAIPTAIYSPGRTTITVSIIGDENEHYGHVLVGILYPGIDTDQDIGGGGNGPGNTSFHESIIVYDYDDNSGKYRPKAVEPGDSFSITLQEIDNLPHAFIRKIQLVVYFRGDYPSSIIGNNTNLKNVNLSNFNGYVDPKVFHLDPQMEHSLTLTIDVSQQ